MAENALTGNSHSSETRRKSRDTGLESVKEKIRAVSQMPAEKPAPDDVISVQHILKFFPIKSGLLARVSGYVQAVDDISFTIKRGTAMGLVGESGCGKTTLGKTVLDLEHRTAGHVLFNGTDITALSHRELRAIRPKIQIIFQDPYSSLSPRLPVSEIIGEAVREHKLVKSSELNEHIDRTMSDCGLQPFHKDRYPHEFSGGQRQRICIARALALNPEFIVCDEPVSALDVSIQAQIINLLLDLQEETGLAYMFVTHDLSVVKYISHDIMVMYLGQLVEKAPSEELFENPMHPYTQALLSAIPEPDIHISTQRVIMQGEITSPINPKPGCRFSVRCPYSSEECTDPQEAKEITPGHYVACCKCLNISL